MTEQYSRTQFSNAQYAADTGVPQYAASQFAYTQYSTDGTTPANTGQSGVRRLATHYAAMEFMRIKEREKEAQVKRLREEEEELILKMLLEMADQYYN